MHAGRARRRKLDSNHREIVAALRAAGRQVVELDGAKVDGAGAPDVLACWPGGFALLEIKTAKGQLSPEQVAWHAAYRGPRGTLLVVRTVAEALAATGVRV